MSSRSYRDSSEEKGQPVKSLRIQLSLETAFRRAGRKLEDSGENTADCDFIRAVLNCRVC